LQYWKEVEKCSQQDRLCQVITYKGTCIGDLQLNPGHRYVALVSADMDEAFMDVAETETQVSAGDAHWRSTLQWFSL
jgi:hypothetical protein